MKKAQRPSNENSDNKMQTVKRHKSAVFRTPLSQKSQVCNNENCYSVPLKSVFRRIFQDINMQPNKTTPPKDILYSSSSKIGTQSGKNIYYLLNML